MDGRPNLATVEPVSNSPLLTIYRIQVQLGDGGRQSTEILDPYSFQLTLVFADSNLRFKDNKFRTFIETTVREETPAHLTVYIKWLDDVALTRFENAYQVFLNELKELSTSLQWPKKITY